MTTPILTGTPPTKAPVGSTYSATFTITGGTPPYVAAGFKGSNPGLIITVNGNDATVTGPLKSAGAFKNLIAQVRDSKGAVGQSPRWTLTVAGTVPPVVVPPVTPPVTSPGTRPVGAGFRPPFLPPVYTAPPSQFPKLSTYKSLGAALDANVGKAIIVDVDMSVTSADLCRHQVALYGQAIGGRKPKLTYTGQISQLTPALLYAVDGDHIARGIEFVGFGDIFDIAIPSINPAPYSYHSGDAYGFARAVPQGMGMSSSKNKGVGLSIDTKKYPLIVGGEGPTWDIVDCDFTNCEQVGQANSDSLTLAPVIAGGWHLVGTYGGLLCNTTVNPDRWLGDVLWEKCTAANGRLQPLNNSHGQHTLFKFGIENPVHKLIRRQNGAMHNITGSYIQDGPEHVDTNSAVIWDWRNDQAASFPSVSSPKDSVGKVCGLDIGWILSDHVQGLGGNEDANAGYWKTLGLSMHDIVLKSPGAADLRKVTGGPEQDGCEFGIGGKQPGDFDGAAQDAKVLVWNLAIIDSPPALIDPCVGLFGFKMDGYGVPTYQCNITFVRGMIKTKGYGGLLRNYGNFPKGLFMDNIGFVDCEFAQDGAGVRNHQFSGTGSLSNVWYYGGSGGCPIDAGTGIKIDGPPKQLTALPVYFGSEYA